MLNWNNLTKKEKRKRRKGAMWCWKYRRERSDLPGLCSLTVSIASLAWVHAWSPGKLICFGAKFTLSLSLRRKQSSLAERMHSDIIWRSSFCKGSSKWELSCKMSSSVIFAVVVYLFDFSFKVKWRIYIIFLTSQIFTIFIISIWKITSFYDKIILDIENLESIEDPLKWKNNHPNIYYLDITIVKIWCLICFSPYIICFIIELKIYA